MARLATVRPQGGPHIVPVSFAVVADTVYTAVDHKPKRARNLQRLANIATHPEVCLLIDHYEEQWTGLWWCRADGTARVLEPGAELRAAERALAGKYEQYRDRIPSGPWTAVDVTRWSGWSAS